MIKYLTRYSIEGICSSEIRNGLNFQLNFQLKEFYLKQMKLASYEMLSFADNSLSCVRGSFLKSFIQITVIGKRNK